MNTPEMSAWYTLTLKRLTHQTQNICNHTSDPLITQQKTNSWMDCDNLLFIELPPGGENIAKGGLAKSFAQVQTWMKNVLGSWKCLIQREKQNQSNRKKNPTLWIKPTVLHSFLNPYTVKGNCIFPHIEQLKKTQHIPDTCVCVFPPKLDAKDCIQ